MTTGRGGAWCHHDFTPPLHEQDPAAGKLWGVGAQQLPFLQPAWTGHGKGNHHMVPTSNPPPKASLHLWSLPKPRSVRQGEGCWCSCIQRESCLRPPTPSSTPASTPQLAGEEEEWWPLHAHPQSGSPQLTLCKKPVAGSQIKSEIQHFPSPPAFFARWEGVVEGGAPQPVETDVS